MRLSYSSKINKIISLIKNKLIRFRSNFFFMINYKQELKKMRINFVLIFAISICFRTITYIIINELFIFRIKCTSFLNKNSCKLRF